MNAGSWVSLCVMGKPRRLRRRDSAEEVGGRRVERKLEVILLWVFESAVQSVTYLILRSVPSNVISYSTRRRTSLMSLCNSVALILFFNDTLGDTHKHHSEVKGKHLPFKHLFDTSTHTLADILPTDIQDPPTER